MNKKTFMASDTTIERKCYIIDAKDKILGRVASKAAVLLRGKHKKTYTPYIDSGDQVIIINADKVRVTGKKLQDKEYQRFSGYPSGQKTLKLGAFLVSKPEKVMQLAVDRMVPGNSLGEKILRKLKIYAGEAHPHQAQKPIPVEI